MPRCLPAPQAAGAPGVAAGPVEGSEEVRLTLARLLTFMVAQVRPGTRARWLAP
jgi:hypothetical protein